MVLLVCVVPVRLRSSSVFTWLVSLKLLGPMDKCQLRRPHSTLISIWLKKPTEVHQAQGDANANYGKLTWTTWTTCRLHTACAALVLELLLYWLLAHLALWQTAIIVFLLETNGMLLQCLTYLKMLRIDTRAIREPFLLKYTISP